MIYASPVGPNSLELVVEMWYISSNSSFIIGVNFTLYASPVGPKFIGIGGCS